MVKIVIKTIMLLSILIGFRSYAEEGKFQLRWKKLTPVLETRVEQLRPQMRLTPSQAKDIILYTNNLDHLTHNLQSLQRILPKVTLELLISTKDRGVAIEDAEKIAKYLRKMFLICNFSNPQAFDENTSHIIGRKWDEIDYQSEYINWKSQEKKYHSQGVENFKTLKSLKNFIVFELQLPYFKKIYNPRNLNVLEKIIQLNKKNSDG